MLGYVSGAPTPRRLRIACEPLGDLQGAPEAYVAEEREDPSEPTIKLADFLRLLPLRGAAIAWFLGAGASAAAGVPTAGDLVWDFKRRLYCSREKVPISACADLLDPSVRARLQSFFDSRPGYPAQGAPEEYAVYFEEAYPDERDRRRVISNALLGAAPSYGHLVLAALLKIGRAEIVWTPNFDTLIEDAVSTVFSTTGALTVADLDRCRIANEAIVERRFPLLGKLHGDFRSVRLKNTNQELLRQDSDLRTALVDVCRTRGLAVIGYSGRDDSVLDAIEEGLANGRGFPSGLYWFRRHDSQVAPRVRHLLATAASGGVMAGFIDIETFDELMGDVLEQIDAVPIEVAARIGATRPRLSAAPIEDPGQGFPVVRLNALPLISYPIVCRRVECVIGGTAEVKAAIEADGSRVLGARSRAGVLAFGSDTDVRRAFHPFHISSFDVHTISVQRLQYNSAELGLLYEALVIGLENGLPLRRIRSRGWVLAIDPAQTSDARLGELRRVARSLTGRIAKTDLAWYEAVRLRIEFSAGRLWVLLEPTVVGDESPDSERGAEWRKVRAEFVRQRVAGRYNSTVNDLLRAWAAILTAGSTEREIRALGVSDGLDAVFTLGSTTAFTRKGEA